MCTLTYRPHRCEKCNRNEFRAVLLRDTLSNQNDQVLNYFFFFVHSLVPGDRWTERTRNLAVRNRRHPLWILYLALVCVSTSLCTLSLSPTIFPWILIYCVSLNYKDGFTSSVNLESDSSSLCAPWKLRVVHWDFARRHFSFKRSIPTAHNFS